MKKRNLSNALFVMLALKGKNKLNKHIAPVHGKKMPFKCNLCDTRCVHKSNLNRHIESVHEKMKPLK